MNTIIKAGLVTLAIVSGVTSVFAKEPAARVISPDPWYQSIHLDDSAVPAEQYFRQMGRDGN
jgi:hypothetical protein